MEHLDFVLWMIGYPLVTSIGDRLTYLCERKYSQGERAVASLIMLGIWVYVGYLLY